MYGCGGMRLADCDQRYLFNCAIRAPRRLAHSLAHALDPFEQRRGCIRHRHHR
jgi:hypothetical protein